MATGTIAPARAVGAALSGQSHRDETRLASQVPSIVRLWHQLAGGLLILSVLSTLLILVAVSRPVTPINPIQAPLEWVSGLKGMPRQDCMWNTQTDERDWYACEVIWQDWHVLLYGARNKITHVYLRPPSSIPLGDLVQWYGRWNQVIHYQHLHHLKWDQLEVYLYVSQGESVSVMSSLVKQIQVKF